MVRNYYIEHVVPDGTAATTYTLAAGTTDVTSGEIDCQGILELSILIALGTMAASATIDIKFQHSDSSGSGFVDIENSALTQGVATDDDKCYAVTIKNPTKRFVRVYIDRGGGNGIINAIFAFKKYRELPVAQSVAAGQFIAAPEVLYGVTGTA